MAVSKEALRRNIRNKLDAKLKQVGGRHTDEAGMALWTVEANGTYYGYGVQLDKYPLTDAGGGKFTIRFYASKSPQVLEWIKAEPYYPGRNAIERLVSSYRLDGDWFKFSDPGDLEKILIEHADPSLARFKSFMKRSGAL